MARGAKLNRAFEELPVVFVIRVYTSQFGALRLQLYTFTFSTCTRQSPALCLHQKRGAPSELPSFNIAFKPNYCSKCNSTRRFC